MKVNSTVLGLIAVFLGVGNAVPTWPAAIDELEDVMFLNSGYKARGFGSHVTPCSFSEFGAGRNTAAEFLRLGFHDMANGNTFIEPRGGIDASIAFELGNGDNVGTGFGTSLDIFAQYLNSRVSVADLIALGVYSSVRSCGGPAVPMRGGRKDATVAGPIGVPQPADGTTVFKARFNRIGFSPVEMVQLVACGHTLGGVHTSNFPAIVPAGTAPNDYALFDTTLDFDNKIVTRYLDGPDTDPLSTGPVVNQRADKAVFLADNNATMRTLRDPAVFQSTCSTVLQKMIELVPTGVNLSDIIAPYDVKPSGIQLTLLAGGTQIKFAGDIRVRTTTRSAAQISSVKVVYKTRTGGTGGTITASSSGTASGFDDTFTFFGFSSNLAASTSISSFTVVITTTGGATETYDNNGNGFPVQDSVIFQAPQSCLSGTTMTVVAAVRDGVAAPSLKVTQKVARSGGIPLPTLNDDTVVMTQGTTYGSYSLYTGNYIISSATATRFGVSSGTFADDFKAASDLGSTCAPLGTTPSSSSSSTTVSQTSSTTSSSASSSPTLSHKPTIGAYTFQGCYTEMPGGRVLSEASFYDYDAMTLDKCAANCAAYTYFGVEYHGECYCGNTLNAASTQAPLDDCYFVCPGNPFQYCGAGNRLDLYKKTSSISSSSVPSSSSTTSRSTNLSTLATTTRSSTTSASPTLSSTTSSASPTLAVVPSVGAYNYYGCWTETSGARALAAAFYPSDSLTIQSCVASCAGYKYAGAEYGRECFCADEFTPGSQLVPNSDCYFQCAGNNYQYCGAGNRLSVYIKNGTTGASSSSSSSRSSTTQTTSRTSTYNSSQTTTRTTTSQSPTATTPSIRPTILANSKTYTYKGCRTEATNIRALSGAAYYNYTSMTLSMCATSCNGWKYWGAEYAGECFCGNTWNTGSANVSDSECNMLCAGDKTEWCGAGNRLSWYEAA